MMMLVVVVVVVPRTAVVDWVRRGVLAQQVQGRINVGVRPLSVSGWFCAMEIEVEEVVAQ